MGLSLWISLLFVHWAGTSAHCLPVSFSTPKLMILSGRLMAIINIEEWKLVLWHQLLLFWEVDSTLSVEPTSKQRIMEEDEHKRVLKIWYKPVNRLNGTKLRFDLISFLYTSFLCCVQNLFVRENIWSIQCKRLLIMILFLEIWLSWF